MMKHITETVPGDIFTVTAHAIPLWEALTEDSSNDEIVGWVHHGDLFTALCPPESENLQLLIGVSSSGLLGAVWHSDFKHLKRVTGDNQL
ncbi:MAG: hypothetical protein WDA41_10770 [Candidatus Neomarinimicrobiota bacterium]|jgi:hypothetical protein